MGTLFIVSTPIGNIDDITFRAVKTLFSVGVIACEDTRHSSLLLSRLKDTVSQGVTITNNEPKYIRYDDKTELSQTPVVIELLESGTDVALVTDAGTPLIADPGFRIVTAAQKRHIPITVIPGVSAVTAALTASGLPTDQFYFLGYLPESQGARLKRLESVKQSFTGTTNLFPTLILYCAPHKMTQTLTDMKSVFGDIPIVVVRELTKMYEEVFHGTMSEATDTFKDPKGEIVILFRVR